MDFLVAYGRNSLRKLVARQYASYAMTKNERKTYCLSLREDEQSGDSRDNSVTRRLGRSRQTDRYRHNQHEFPVTSLKSNKKSRIRGTNQLAMSRRTTTHAHSTQLSQKWLAEIYTTAYYPSLSSCFRYFALYEANPRRIHTAYLSSVRLLLAGCQARRLSRSPVGSSKEPVQALLQI